MQKSIEVCGTMNVTKSSRPAVLNLLFHWSPLICTSIVFRDRGIVMWQSLLFSQLIKNNLSNRCRIHKIYPSRPYRILCLFFFSVIITNPYLRARTIQTSSLPNDSSRPLFKQIEIFSSILTVYFSYKYFPLYTRATRVPPLDFAFLSKSLQGQSIPQISPKSDGERLGTRQESLESWPRGLSRKTE